MIPVFAPWLWETVRRYMLACLDPGALIVVGLAAGVAFYFGFQIVGGLVTALLAILLVDPHLPIRRAAWLAIGALLLGSAPFWIH